MRLIDADELRLLIQREYNTDDSDYPTQYQFGLQYTMTAIDKAPTVEPQLIKGRWVRKESDLSWWYECSVCGESPLYDPYADEVRSPFCPFCGSDMRGDEDEVD